MPFQTEERLSSVMDKTHRSKILRWALKIQNLQQSTTFSVGMLVPLIIFKKPKRKPGWSRPATRVIMMDVDPQQSSIEGPWNVNHHCWIFFCAYDYCKQCVWASCVAVLWRCIDFAWGVCVTPIFITVAWTMIIFKEEPCIPNPRDLFLFFRFVFLRWQK